MKIDKDLKEIAKQVQAHPEWLEGAPEDLRQIVDELNSEILQENRSEKPQIVPEPSKTNSDKDRKPRRIE